MTEKKNFGHTRKTLFLTSKKEDQVARIGVMGGGGVRGFGQCPKENVFFLLMSSLTGCSLNGAQFTKMQQNIYAQMQQMYQRPNATKYRASIRCGHIALQ